MKISNSKDKSTCLIISSIREAMFNRIYHRIIKTFNIRISLIMLEQEGLRPRAIHSQVSKTLVDNSLNHTAREDMTLKARIPTQAGSICNCSIRGTQEDILLTIRIIKLIDQL